MKNTIALVLSFFLCKLCFSQAFVAEGNNTLIGRNATLNLTPLNVGLGTNIPSALLHTNGTLRFEGLPNVHNNRVLVTDANGNVTWRDASTFMDNNAWQILGNTNINDATHFLGTSNNQAVIFKVNSQRRLSIGRQFTSGSRNISQVEVGVPTDGDNLTNLFVWSRDIVGASLPFFISSNVADMQFSNLPGNNNTLGRLIRLNQGNTNANGGNDFYDVGISKEARGPNDTVKALYFTGLQRPGTLTQMPVKAITISSANNTATTNIPCNVGINIPWNSFPTAQFHTIGTVRHQNLPNNPGNLVVIDGAGNVYRSTGRTSDAIDNDLNDLLQRVEVLENRIIELQDQINRCCNREIFGKGKVVTEIKSDGLKLFQNNPNPFRAVTNLRYSIPDGLKKVSLHIYNLEGRELKRINISKAGEGSVQVDGNSLVAGMYIAILIAENGQTSETIKMILTN